MGMPLPSKSFANTAMTGAIPQNAEDARTLGLQLALERKTIDDEIQSHVKTLREQNATMTSPLIDAQGFPVATTDIVAVRVARSRIIALRNDREGLEQRIQEVLEVALANRGQERETASAAIVPDLNSNVLDTLPTNGRAWARMDGRRDGLSMLVDTQTGDASDWRSVGGLEAFAKVNAVAESSPAQSADLFVEDEILEFGGLDGTTSHQSNARKDLRNLPSVVQEGKEISIVVLRKDAGGHRTIKRLRLTPMSGWGGRGLLGCHLIPI